jgi:hypothetical protein
MIQSRLPISLGDFEMGETRFRDLRISRFSGSRHHVTRQGDNFLITLEDMFLQLELHTRHYGIRQRIGKLLLHGLSREDIYAPPGKGTIEVNNITINLLVDPNGALMNFDWDVPSFHLHMFDTGHSGATEKEIERQVQEYRPQILALVRRAIKKEFENNQETLRTLLV